MLEARRQFKRLNPRNTPLFTDFLRELGKDFTLQWLTKQIRYGMVDAIIHVNIIEYEIKMSRVSENKV